MSKVNNILESDYKKCLSFIKKQLVPHLKFVDHILLFGSEAKGTREKGKDIDIIVFSKNRINDITKYCHSKGFNIDAQSALTSNLESAKKRLKHKKTIYKKAN